MEYEAGQKISGFIELNRVLRDGYVLRVEDAPALSTYSLIFAEVNEDNIAYVYGINRYDDEIKIDELGRFMTAVKNTPSAKFFIAGADEDEEDEVEGDENIREFNTIKEAIQFMGEEPTGHRRLSEEEKAQIMKLKDFGFTSKQIARKFNISEAKANKIANPPK